MDKITQIISHFAGQFHVTVEQARLKELYEEFAAGRKMAQLEAGLPDADVNVKAPYELIDYSPNIPYVPVPPELFPVDPHGGMAFGRLELLVPEAQAAHTVHAKIVGAFSPDGSAEHPQLEPHGSVAVQVNQHIMLADNDYVSVGGHQLVFTPAPADDSSLGDMSASISELSPIDDLTIEDGDVAAFVTAAAARLEAMPEQDDGGITVISSDRIEGIYVNGEAVDVAPELKDYADLIFDDEEGTGDELADTGGVSTVLGEGEVALDVSVELTAGSNALVNSSVIMNDWAGSSTIAVVGDYTKLNAIVQVNAHSDVDSLGESLNGWSLGESDPVSSFNIAMFNHIELEQDAAPPETIGGFPTNWVVSEVEGDLTIVNWVEQYSFVMDNDVAVLSSSGVTTVVGTGENTAFNDISLQELSSSYDLIIVGGSVYDANLIQQYNILLDNDLIGAVEGFQTTGQASASIGSNLVWNQAAIVEAGGNATPQAMPDYYLQTANSLAGSNNEIDPNVLQDQAFAGIETLRVLYVSGNIINLNAVTQTNILGDSDQVALAMNQLTPRADAEWTISTGHNQLVNFATIVDVDAFGRAYVGGHSYSDEVLVQADLTADTPALATSDPDALVNEAVVFLDSDADDTEDTYEYGIHPTIDPAPGDPMLG